MTMMVLTMLAAAANPPTTYRAVGTEPFWNVAIDGRRLRLSEPGKPDVVLLARQPSATARGWRWRSAAITVETERRPCSDGMSDRRYPDRVTVTYRGRVLRGCGGAGEAVVKLADTAWHVVAIDGRAVRLPTPPTLRFVADRVEGFAGCNRFSASYALEGDRLTPGPLRATRRACIGPGDTVEARLMEILGAPLTLRQPKDGLVLTGNGGSVTLRRD